MSKVTDRARARIAAQQIKSTQAGIYGIKQTAQPGAGTGNRLASVGGALYDSALAYGAVADVQNIGRPAAAVYGAGAGGGVVVVSGGGGSSGGGGGGGMVVHAFDSTWHAGLLSWAKVNKAGSALTDIATRPHSALTGIGANDHHNAATGGTGITVSAGQVVSLNTHDIFSLHTVSGGANLDLVGQSGANVLARVTPAFDVSAGVERVLKSNGSGFVRLKSLDVAGNVDVTSGGDLTVGNNVLFVDVSLGSIGVDRAPDPQFALDVNGPLRATYLVGKHAIQLDHALLLCHYDAMPGSYAGDFNGLNGRIGSTSGAYFLPGKFNSGVARTSPATNYCTRPSFEGDTLGAAPGGWTAFQSGAGAVWSVTNAIAHTGKQSVQVGASSTGNAMLSNSGGTVSVPNGQTVYASVWTYRTEAWSGWIGLVDSGNTLRAQSNFDTSGNAVLYEWVEQTVEWTNNTGSTLNIYVRLNNSAGANGRYIWFDSVALYGNTAAGGMYPYFDGNCVNCAWSGTANQSTSSNTASALTYPAQGNIDPYSGTILFWVKPYSVANARWFQMQSTLDSDLYMQIGTNSGGTIFARCSSSTIGATVVNGSAATAGQWHLIAVTYTPTLVTLVINGAVAGSYVPTVPYQAGASDQMRLLHAGDAIIDEFVTTADVLHPNMIRSIYESDSPVFAESSVTSFRATVNGLFYFDEEGGWGRNALGQAMFGMYGGEGTKTWGGVTLETGDLLIGRSPNYMQWDDSAAAMIFSAGMIPGTALADGAVTGTKISDTTITAGKIANGTITATQIQNTTITGSKIATGTIVANHLAITDVADIATLYTGSIVVGSGNKLWLNEGGDGALAIGGSVKASAPFRVTAAGQMTSTSGNIGGVTIASGRLETGSGSDSAGIVGTSSGAHATMFWGGASYAGRDTALFRVTNLGHIHARNLVASVSGQALDVWSYSDGLVSGSQLASFYRFSGTDSAVAVGHNANKLAIIRADAANGTATLVNYGTGSLIFGTGGTRSAQLTSGGDLSTYASDGTTVLGRISSSGVVKSRKVTSSSTPIAAFTPETAAVVANGSYAQLDSLYGLLLIINAGSGQSGLFLLRGSATPILISQTSGNEFTVVGGTSGKTNLDNSVALRVENLTGSQRSYSIITWTVATY